ncbi:MAG: DUF983 domain-containing protein [Actinomycetota bacterium]|nr:DUF983 domain-containing protein [Actinomycetota bacterium]
MVRLVRAKDGRTWTVRSRISWNRPAMAEQFEHDMAAGYVSGIAMVGVVVVLTLFVVFWTPAEVVIPAWFVLSILLLLLLLPMGWALQRPWVITADTAEPMGSEGEHWEGVVRGAISAREEVDRVEDELRLKATPDERNVTLTRLTSTAPLRDS